jgi:hypothetical protein
MEQSFYNGSAHTNATAITGGSLDSSVGVETG